jgi:hypothetical protein
MDVNTHFIVQAKNRTVTLLIRDIGMYVMQPAGAVELARHLLDAANEIEPGTVRFWPPKVEL